VRLRGCDHHDRVPPAVRRAVRDDAGWPGEQHAQRGAPDVRGRLPLVEPGVRGGGGLRAVRADPRRVAGAALAPTRCTRQRGRAMRRRLEAVVVHVVLAVAAVLTLLPLVWMVAASLMPAGEASALPLRLWPSAPTLEHYRALFARLDIGRHAAISAG